MSGHKLSDHAVAELVRCKCILEVERDALFDALARLLSHIDLPDSRHGARNAVLIGKVAIDNQEFEAALRHAQFVLRDEADAGDARARRTEAEAKAMQ
jgi:hypothetical protein